MKMDKRKELEIKEEFSNKLYLIQKLIKEMMNRLNIIVK
jgi:hypothetical protein